MFFLADPHRVLPWLIRVSPLKREKTTLLFESIGSLSSSVIFATVASGLVQSLLIGLACLILSAPGTLLITMSAFVLSFIPVVGTMPISVYLIGSSFLSGDWTFGYWIFDCGYGCRFVGQLCSSLRTEWIFKASSLGRVYCRIWSP
ncbi:MAG: AI-2E family transporter [Bdellovibrionales bacterium]|nr:AI-2E family transporter [Bdellovibrionales bacterium]